MSDHFERHGGNRNVVVAGSVAAFVLFLDQLTKLIVLRTIEPGERIRLVLGIELVRASNRGVAFSLADGRAGVGIATVVLVLVLLAVVRRELRRGADDPHAPSAIGVVAFGALIGGAIGNLSDRLLRGQAWGRGAVVDFIDPKIWPIFNIADAALSCGCVALIVSGLLQSKRSDR